MKRLKMPRIPTRIPVPNLSSMRRSSQEANAKNEVPAVLPPDAEKSPEIKSTDQTKEANEVKHRKINVPKIPLPSVSKAGATKLRAPRIPLRRISKPKISKEAVAPSSREPGIVTSQAFMPDQKAPPAPAPQPADSGTPTAAPVPSAQLTDTKTQAAPVPSAQLADTKSPAAPKAKSKSKISMPKLSKVSMPNLPKGKGGAKTKTTGKRILALSIEGTELRLLNYHNNAIESWKKASFDARLLKMGQVADPEGLGEVIKSAMTEIETSRSYVICALPGLRSVSRIITIPNVGKKELDAVVPREVRRTMTVSEEDNYFHWQILSPETDTPQIRVFLLAVPKEPVSLLIRAINHAGLNPANIDLKPLALMRAINQKDAIIANCEGNSMELVIVSDDTPVLIRSVFLGEGVANQDYTVGRISDELGRTVVTYNEINKEHPLDPNTPVYLTGQAAAGVPFALNVAALTGRTVQPLESPIPLPADFPIAEYMVNIGLILKVI